MGIHDISLHSYRYAWAERAKSCGYPERWAQNALGHNSPAVHQAYAKQGVAVCPPLDEYERAQQRDAQSSSPQAAAGAIADVFADEGEGIGGTAGLAGGSACPTHWRRRFRLRAVEGVNAEVLIIDENLSEQLAVHWAA